MNELYWPPDAFALGNPDLKPERATNWDIGVHLRLADASEPSMLPQHVQDFIETRGLERTICDYIAGMTDRFALQEHNKLFDPSSLP